MASIDQYESLKSNGTWQDRLTYVVSLSDKNEIENHFKKSASTSYDDLQMLIFLSWLTKNDKNLLEIFKSPSFPTRQRATACQRWLLLQKDEKQILEFLVASINDKTIPRYLKQKMVKKLCHIDVLRKSSSFFYDTACHVIDSKNYSRYNFAAYLLPFSQHESNNIVTDSTRLEFIRYQSMTQNLYDKFLLLMKNTGSDVFQRQKNYVLLFQCALLTNQQFVKTVFQFIAKRFANEQFIVIESFFNYLTSAQAKLHFQILPDNLESIETIINIAMNHLQDSYRIRSEIRTYGTNLLQCVEYYRNQEAKKIIQEFAWKIIKKYYSCGDFASHVRSIPKSYTETWRQIADFHISDIYPALISESKDAGVSKLRKLKLLRIFRRLTHTYNKTLEWFHAKFYSSSTVEEIEENPGLRTRYFVPKTFDKVIVCLPGTFALDEESLLKQFHLLKTKLNASNAMFVADTMLSISRRINEELFLKSYLELLRDEQLPKLGITAYKEVLRLLILYSSDPTLVETDIKPLWDSHPHQDLRACLILILLHFVGNHNNSDDIDKAIWQILEQAAEDDYLIIVQSLFAFHQEHRRRRLPRSKRGTSCWPLTRWKNLSNPLYEEFVNRIQLKVLDHPTSLNARSWAWENIEYEHCDINEVFDKAQKLCIQFDETGNKLWEQAFNKIILLYRENRISSINTLIDFVKKVASLREDIDLQENAIDCRHDLPAYRRLDTILGILINSLESFNNEKQLALRAFAPIIIQLDKTLASYAGEILMKTAQNKEDMENQIKFLQENLPENFFEDLLMDLSDLLRYESTDYFISKMDIDEKLAFAEWFINEKNRPLFVYDFLTEYVFNHKDVNRQQCQQIIRSWRQSENLRLKQKSMSYCVPWDKNTPIDDKDNDSFMFDYDIFA
ncbi:unnamed protein product [Rotaria magnacalcarata]|uniref:Uncharacterized protein n=2 Tax=Rotaria magnacalcarata TaxID=392030 RepID=A0A816VF67_9BILA|nr:unnamed protein product [Rotaria magnacalcarata]